MDVIEGSGAGSVAKALADAEAYTDNKIASEVYDRNAAIKVEHDDRVAADDGIKARLDTLEGAASVEGSVKKALADAEAYADQKIADLIGGAPAMLDTLKEIADQLSNDESVASALATTVSTETSDRIAGDNLLSARLDTLEGPASVEGSVKKALADAEAYTDSKVSEETSARTTAETAIKGRLDVLEGSGEGSVAKALSDAKAYTDAETAARTTADDGIKARLDTLEGSGAGSVAKALSDAKAYTDSKVSEETSARTTAETAIGARIDQEITDRQNAITSLSNSVAGAAPVFAKKSFTLDATDISNQYVDLDYIAYPHSVVAFIDRLGIHEDVDYNLTTVNGKTRLSFAPMIGGAEEPVAGDQIRLSYAWKAADQSQGGGNGGGGGNMNGLAFTSNSVVYNSNHQSYVISWGISGNVPTGAKVQLIMQDTSGNMPWGGWVSDDWGNTLSIDPGLNTVEINSFLLDPTANYLLAVVNGTQPDGSPNILLYGNPFQMPNGKLGDLTNAWPYYDSHSGVLSYGLSTSPLGVINQVRGHMLAVMDVNTGYVIGTISAASETVDKKGVYASNFGWEAGHTYNIVELPMNWMAINQVTQADIISQGNAFMVSL